MNKKGAITDIVIFVVMAFIIVTFLGIWLYGHGLLTDTLQGITANVGNTSVSAAVNDTIGQVDTAENSLLPTIAFALIFGMALTIFLTAYFVRTHPLFIVPYIFFVVLGIIVSVYVSNAYEDVFVTNAQFGPTFESMSAATFILLNLPIWVTVIGFIGIIIVFANISRDREIEGGIV